jgi:hypothetical protein
VLNEFLKVAFRKRLSTDLERPQKDLDEHLVKYNTERINEGKRCQGRTPMETFEADNELLRENIVA